MSARKRVSRGATGATISRVAHQKLAGCPGTKVASMRCVHSRTCGRDQSGRDIRKAVIPRDDQHNCTLPAAGAGSVKEARPASMRRRKARRPGRRESAVGQKSGLHAIFLDEGNGLHVRPRIKNGHPAGQRDFADAFAKTSPSSWTVPGTTLFRHAASSPRVGSRREAAEYPDSWADGPRFRSGGYIPRASTSRCPVRAAAATSCPRQKRNASSSTSHHK